MIANYVKLLSKEKLEKIHERTLYILESIGIKVSHQKALRLLQDAGAKVDFETEHVYMPRHLVEACIACTPKKCFLGARDPRHRIELPHPEGGFYTRSGVGSKTHVDLSGDQFRNVKMADTEEWVRVIDALENIDICCPNTPDDVPAEIKDLYMAKCALENTQKHIMIAPYSMESLEYFGEMGVIVAGGKSEFKHNPIFSMACCSTSPLSYKSMDVEIIYLAGEYGIPLQIASLNSPGGTSPITIAGSVVTANAEIVAGLVLTHIISPNTSVICVPQNNPLNMVTGSALRGTVEAALADAAGVQVIKDLYHLPTRTYGFSTDALFPKGQAMIERTFFGVLMALNGADILGQVGNIEGNSITSIPQLVIDNDIIGMLRKLMKGINIDDEELAIEVIAEAAPQGDFLQHRHTLKHCRDAYQPDTFFRNGRKMWQAQGSKDILDRARDKAVKILNERKHYLSDTVTAELAKIIEKAKQKNCR